MFMQFDKNNNVNLISDPIPIKYLPEGKIVVCSLIATSIKECDCSDAWNLFACHCENGSFHINVFDKSYGLVTHADSLRINIIIAYMHRRNDRSLYVSNEFHNTNVPIHKRVSVSPPPYYLYWFEIAYPNIPLNRHDVPLRLQ